MRYAPLALTLALLTACNAVEGTDDAKRAVADQFRDPSSAEFRKVFRRGYDVCGEVNAKNGFGAYVGFVRFVALQISSQSNWTVIMEPNDLSDDERNFQTVWSMDCAPYGGTAP